MKQQKIITINENNKISVVDFGNGVKEIAHLENNSVSYKYMNDPIQTTEDDWKLDEQVCELASEILYGILSEEYDARLECDAQVIIETFTYSINISVVMEKNNKLVYDISTLRESDREKDELLDRNKARRATFKGLLSYIEKFDR